MARDDDFECANCEEEFRAKDRRDWHPPESADPNEVMYLCPSCHAYARGYAEGRAAEPQPEGRTAEQAVIEAARELVRLRHQVIPQSVEHTRAHQKRVDEQWRELKARLAALDRSLSAGAQE